ncbi:MAG: DNA cytosine methyltransferase [Aestuariivita sp.]|nr:DNA cytosine methyltransferase [Aestuariivita sp.]
MTAVPQQRNRAIIAAVPKEQAYAFPASNLCAVTAGDALARSPMAVRIGCKLLAPNHVDVTPDRDRYRISFVPEGLWLSKTKGAPPDTVQRLTPKDSTKFRRLDRSKPSHTLHRGEALYHPTEDRHITPREATRLQSFPDKHVLEGPIR